MELNPYEIKGLDYEYGTHKVLDSLDLTVNKGEVLGILGPNGCGKTTLLKNLNKNLSPKVGTVLLEGEDLKDLQKKDIARIVAAVPQTNEIKFSFTARDIIAMGRMPFQGLMSPETREDVEIIEDAIDSTGSRYLEHRYINTMSGGERQRVMIARAIAQTPRILLMDEPTLHLDVNTQFEALDLVYRLSRERNLTVIIVSHDLPMVARYCDRIAMIHDRKVMCIGTPEEVLTPENMDTVFHVDAELITDSKTGRYSVMLHGSSRS
ncbi:MAG: ABC transporter ATP-binding protein [archaeon]|nr:ABC transporter ATP-binding protein [archaeon]